MPDDGDPHHSEEKILGLHFLGCNLFLFVIYFKFQWVNSTQQGLGKEGNRRAALQSNLAIWIDVALKWSFCIVNLYVFLLHIIPERPAQAAAPPRSGSVAAYSRPGAAGGVAVAQYTPPVVRPKLRPTSPANPPPHLAHPVAPGPLSYPGQNPGPPPGYPPAPAATADQPQGAGVPLPALPIPPPSFGPGNWMPCFLWVPALPMPGTQPLGPPPSMRNVKLEKSDSEKEAIMENIYAIINVGKYGQKNMLKALSSLIPFFEHTCYYI